MAWRFKASKFKNAVGTPARRNECLLDIDVGELRSSSNAVIAASSAFVAFSQEGRVTGCIGVVDAAFAKERDPNAASKNVGNINVELFHPHAGESVTCMEFSPFDDGLLATGSEDSTVKLWNISDDRSAPQCIFVPAQDMKVETLHFHPTCDFLLSSSAGDRIQVVDLIVQKELLGFHGKLGGPIVSMDWRYDGTELAAVDQHSRLMVLDPRKVGSAACVETAFASNKEAHVVWLSDDGGRHLLVTGFDKTRERKASVYDVRNAKSPAGSLEFGTGIGSVVPLYDPDTGMLFLSARGETGISFAEIVSNVPTVRSRVTSQFGTKATCLAPKRSLGVMNGEVNVVYQLSLKALVPIRFKVPRKSYRDFHADIFPLTRGVESPLVPELWMQDKNVPVPRISLDPAVIRNDELKFIRPRLSARMAEAEAKKDAFLKAESNASRSEPKAKPAAPTKEQAQPQSGEFIRPAEDSSSNSTALRTNKVAPMKRGDDVRSSCRELRDHFENRLASQSSSQTNPEVFAVPKAVVDRNHSFQQTKRPASEVSLKPTKAAEDQNDVKKGVGSLADAEVSDSKDNFRRQASDRKSKTFGRVAKFRHMKGNVPPRAQQYENLRDLNPSLPTECDAIKGNEERFAISLRGPGGKILVWDLANTGRLPDAIALLALINTAAVTDFAWDPFNASRLAVATDDGTINIWDVSEVSRDGGPEEDGEGARNQPKAKLRRPEGVPERITVIKWHPSAEDILAVAHCDGSVDIWNVEPECKLAFQFPNAGNGSSVWSMEWSPDGKHLAVLSRDGKLRLLDGRTGNVVAEGEGFTKGRGARVIWVLGGSMLLLSGFENGSSRVVKLYETSNLQKGTVKTLEMDVSPSLVVPLYDEDSSTLFLYAKGDTTIHTYEVLNEAPYLYPLSPHRSSTPHHGFTLLPKRVVDVKAVEFARALRLTDSTIEPINFVVPRVKSEYFQDDLFPPTLQSWIPSVDASDWICGVNKEQPLVSLKPDGMFSLSGNSGAGGDSYQNTSVSKRSVSDNHHVSAPVISVSASDVTDKEKQKNVEHALSNLVSVNLALEQDDMEGVDPQEWD